MKPLQRDGIRRELIGKDFQRYMTPQPGVLRAIHDTHAAVAQLGQDTVMNEGLAEHPWDEDNIFGGGVIFEVPPPGPLATGREKTALDVKGMLRR